jgi:hypothetical protein
MATGTVPCYTDVRYRETLHNVPKVMSELLSSYSGVPKDEQVAHITKMRNEAYAQFPYPVSFSRWREPLSIFMYT